MKKIELLRNLELMKSEVEWEYPIDYAATLDICEGLVRKHYQENPDLDCALKE